MTHPPEERLLLSYYEADRGVERHLARCAGCSARFEEFRRLLAAVERMPVPERGESYGREVWSRIAPRLALERPGRPRLFSPFSLSLAAGLAAVAAAAFLAGRFVGRGDKAAVPPSVVRERVLVFALGEHLDRSQAVLLEFVHSAEGGEPSGSEVRARDLVEENRLYRQVASLAGDRAASGVLDDLERVLLEVAHASRETAADGPAASTRTVTEAAENVLFELKVLRSRMRGQEEPRSSIERKRT